jgi:hypothetical protein
MAKPLDSDPTTADQSSLLTVDELLKKYGKKEVEKAMLSRDYKG